MSVNYIEKYTNTALPSLFLNKKHKSDDTKVHTKPYGVVQPPVDAPEYSIERRLREIDQLNAEARRDVFKKNFNGKDYHDSKKSRNSFCAVCGSILAAIGIYFFLGKKKH